MNPQLETAATRWRIPDPVLDLGPPVVLAMEGLLSLRFATDAYGARRLLLLLALMCACVALAWRRRRPAEVLAVTIVVNLVANWGPIGTLPMLAALFTVGQYCNRRTLAYGAALAFAGSVAAPPLHGLPISAGAIGSRFVVVGLAVALGLYVNTRAQHIDGLRERAERLEREQQLLAEHAVAEERVRIARELHDVVAHNVSLMVVQSQALAATGGVEQQGAALGRVADLGREALSEMHRMLGVLRLEDGDGAGRAPQPGLGDIADLVGRTREAGLEAELVYAGRPRELPPGVELSLYRIVQEALTNVIRHAGARRATVRLAFEAGRVELTVIDDGAGAALLGPDAPPGHGLVGMRERVALLGGELRTGPEPSGRGYRVHAIVPTV